MLFITPILSFSTYMPPTDSFDLSLKILAHSDPNSESFGVIFKSFVEIQVSDKEAPLILVVAGPEFWNGYVSP